MFFPNFNIIGVVVREPHLSKVEGVDVVFILKYDQTNF